MIAGAPLAAGWTGKLWAVARASSAAAADAPTYLLLTDADIAHAPADPAPPGRARRGRRLALISLMARLQSGTWRERLLIPAFVFFFDMLFPFAWVNDPRRKTAAAAGGCMLVRREALEAAGGIAAIRGEIIDDCALGARLKAQGPIWLGLTRPRSEPAALRSAWRDRPHGLALGLRPARLFAVAAGRHGARAWRWSILAAPVLALSWTRPAAGWGWRPGSLWPCAFQPMLRYYRLWPLWGLALPLIGALYTVFTLQSAIERWRGRGGMWKGRVAGAGGVAS